MLASIGQMIVSWLLSWAWSKAEAGLKDYLANDHLKGMIKDTLAEYERLVLSVDAKQDAGVPLSKEEEDEVRRKKIELEERLLNAHS